MDSLAFHEIIEERLKQALDLIEDCGRAYSLASDTMKRAFNQAIFEKMFVDGDGKIVAEFNQPFNILLELKNSSMTFTSLTEMGRKEVDSSFGQRNNPDQKIFFDQGYTNKLMVDTGGLEPSTSCV
jgi:hypothetical protein